MKKLVSITMIFAMLLCITACSTATSQDDIIILFTNDVHCNIDDNIGYAGLAAYKKSVAAKNKYVTLVDAGDAVSISNLGAISKGELIVDIMNSVGYDLATFGNHEFSYGIDQLAELMSKAKYEYICCNLIYTGAGENKFSNVKPYKIINYGDTSVAFIGVTTPLCINLATPTYFKENEEYVYDFLADKTGETLFKRVQECVDECHAAGADYVVVISHLGDEDEIYSSSKMIANTVGIDALIDGHSHSYAPCKVVQNKNGQEVIISQTGTGLTSIGQLIITRSGNLMIGCISDYKFIDEKASSEISRLSRQYEQRLNEVVGHADKAISICDENGIRLVRCRETGIGNLCADAYRAVANADIAYINGGGIRSSLNAGDITYQNIIDVQPFGNMICTMELSGAEILDMLEYFSRNVCSEYAENGNVIGESGDFANVSGLKYTINTGIKSSVTTDENDMLVSVDGDRRVSEVCVLKNGEYVPISPEENYILASHDYMLKNGGDGMEKFLAGHEVILNDISSDYLVLINYIKSLSDLSPYYEAEGRITIK